MGTKRGDWARSRIPADAQPANHDRKPMQNSHIIGIQALDQCPNAGRAGENDFGYWAREPALPLIPDRDLGPISKVALHSLPDVLAFGESGTDQLCPDEATLRLENRIQ